MATTRALAAESCTSTLAQLLGIAGVGEDALYEAMDWLVQRQADSEQQLAGQYLEDGSSTYLEGEHCPLAKRGYSRDRKRGTVQIVFGLLCNAQGCPVAVGFQGSSPKDC